MSQQKSTTLRTNICQHFEIQHFSSLEKPTVWGSTALHCVYNMRPIVLAFAAARSASSKNSNGFWILQNTISDVDSCLLKSVVLHLHTHYQPTTLFQPRYARDRLATVAAAVTWNWNACFCGRRQFLIPFCDSQSNLRTLVVPFASLHTP